MSASGISRRAREAGAGNVEVVVEDMPAAIASTRPVDNYADALALRCDPAATLRILLRILQRTCRPITRCRSA